MSTLLRGWERVAGFYTSGGAPQAPSMREADTIRGAMPDTFVAVDRVDLAYDEAGGNAIEDVSLAMREHEFIAMVGPSGCGKSTFMKLCSGLRPPTKGTVVVNGRPVSGPLKIVGMAFQNSTLLPWRTTLANVLLPLEIVEPYRSSFKQKREEYEARAKSLLKSVGLEGFEQKFPWELSGGMQQRASICRALVHEPKLLLLDEPFAALDAFTREELWCVLRDLWTLNRFTVVLVTHELREAAFLADTVYVMSKRPGRILARRVIDLPRPRDLEVTYTDRFAEIVRELREHIGQIRKT
jgi:NitT/TauT family transport system ATP-binding protein